MIEMGSFIEHIINVGKEEITEFTIISFPAWDLKPKVTRSYLSQCNFRQKGLLLEKYKQTSEH
jgi:hypothetical protein